VLAPRPRPSDATATKWKQVNLAAVVTYVALLVILEITGAWWLMAAALPVFGLMAYSWRTYQKVLAGPAS
jgi:hypothetical protein